MRKLIPTMLMCSLMVACTHKIELETKEPITVNMNIKIDHEIVVKVDKELDEVFAKDDTIF